jgi:hypothetical protein
MDTYSNILFVKEAFAPLSHLAHRLAGSDKYTPEACCVIGNYYSLKVRIAGGSARYEASFLVWQSLAKLAAVTPASARQDTKGCPLAVLCALQQWAVPLH